MSDATYQPAVYRKQGGNEMVVASGGTLTIEPGATVAAGAKLDFSTITPGAETTGSLITTGSTWLVHTAVGGCAAKLLCSYSGASGDFATLRMRARSDAAGAIGGDGQMNGVVCGNFSASANINNHANLFGVQGYAQPNAYTHNNAAHVSCGVYSCIDASGASSGRRWSLWTDDHSLTKAAGGHYLHRLSKNPVGGAGVAIDGVWTIYAGDQAPVLINFENNGAGNPFVAGTTMKSGTGLGLIAVKDAVSNKVGYINVYES